MSIGTVDSVMDDFLLEVFTAMVLYFDADDGKSDVEDRLEMTFWWLHSLTQVMDLDTEGVDENAKQTWSVPTTTTILPDVTLHYPDNVPSSLLLPFFRFENLWQICLTVHIDDDAIFHKT